MGKYAMDFIEMSGKCLVFLWSPYRFSFFKVVIFLVSEATYYKLLSFDRINSYSQITFENRLLIFLHTDFRKT